ncbi:head-tail connector protein [Paenibacillus sp. J5C_2022]|uniref:head-tail connector protein n=1 Tax=Paenibacillus sp. J5C2022 TaxID=2977129 RepID=UPI0021CE4025|nr:head-tail connector protein [Paenibacillus sp. J5C2022]MCU6709406.1 head-tail connector protein [Paenibacillus sp. J5C2022]
MLDFIKTYLRIDGNYEDMFLVTLLTAAKVYIREATGVEVDEDDFLHRLTISLLVTQWYENRIPVGKADDMSFSLRSLLTQIEYKASDAT